METGKTVLLIFSQLFYTLVGAVVNIVLGITLRDLPNLPCSTYYVILANISVCNLIICTFVKTILSIYVSYAYIKVKLDMMILRRLTCVFRMRVRLICSSAPCSR